MRATDVRGETPTQDDVVFDALVILLMLSIVAALASIVWRFA